MGNIDEHTEQQHVRNFRHIHSTGHLVGGLDDGESLLMLHELHGHRLAQARVKTQAGDVCLLSTLLQQSLSDFSESAFVRQPNDTDDLRSATTPSQSLGSHDGIALVLLALLRRVHAFVATVNYDK